MPTSGILDAIVAGFVSAAQAGMGTLSTYSLPLLAVFGLLAWYFTVGPSLVAGGGNLGESLGNIIFLLIKVGIYYWILVNLSAMGNAAFETFAGWGAAASGGGFAAGDFLRPSRMLDLGVVAARPLLELQQRFTGMAVLFNAPTIAVYGIAYFLVIGAFAFVALHLIMTIVEFHLALLLSAVLIPFGVLSTTAFLAEFAVSWLVAGLIRVLLTTAIMAIALPLFSLLTLELTGDGDPTLYSALILCISAGIFAILAWKIPDRAAGIGGRGMALALSGGVLIPQPAVYAGLGAIRGVSRLITSR